MLSEQQSLEECGKLISSVFACVAYIREFFPDETFQNDRYGSMSLKKIVRATNSHADRFLDWIEKGCYDALKNRYLETVTLGIFSNPDEPEKVLESYTLTITYPSSPMHELIRSLREPTASMTVQVDGGEPIKLSPGEGSFEQQICKILRALCVMLQTLRQLPEKKHASMQLTYYDELTPANYEPPGFEATVFDVKYLFEMPIVKHDFGQACSEHHRVGIKLETGTDSMEEKERKETVVEKVPEQVTEQATDECASLTISQGLHLQGIVPEMQNCVTTTKDKKDENACPAKCLCGDDEDDLDMICCDKCKNWQHTPCAGFCTNRDKRIPENYICYTCQYENKKLLNNLRDLASFRRAISVVYSEGLESITWLSKRLGCGVAKASKLIRRLEAEGLIVKPNSQVRTFHYLVQKTPEAKDKIRYFFGMDLSVFPELIGFFKGKQPVMPVIKSPKRIGSCSHPRKRRKSATTEKVSCN